MSPSRNRNIRLSQILPSLNGGGAERISINLANDWSSRGFDVEFALMEHSGEFLPLVDPAIRIRDLQAPRIRNVFTSLLRYFRNRQPDVTLVHMWPLTSVTVFAWLVAGSPGKLFLCEHAGLSDHVVRDLATPMMLVKLTLRLSYSLASGVVAVSRGAATDLAKLAGLSPSAISVIHNPVVPVELQPRIPVDVTERQHLWEGSFSRTFINIGTLKTSKNQLLLLDAFAQVADELDAGLVILGEGSQRAALEHRIDVLGLHHRVRLPGFDPNPEPWLRAADLFVFSSDFEGLPTVLIEALAAGTPVVSTSCPHGPDEILHHGRFGVLVPVGDRAALAEAIRSALSRNWDPASLQRRALDFSIPRQALSYLELFGCIRP